MCFGMFTLARSRLFQRESSDLPVCYLQWRAFLKYMYVYFKDLFDLSNKQTSIYILYGDISSDKEKNYTCDCVFVYEMGDANYIL